MRPPTRINSSSSRNGFKAPIFEFFYSSSLIICEISLLNSLYCTSIIIIFLASSISSRERWSPSTECHCFCRFLLNKRQNFEQVVIIRVNCVHVDVSFVSSCKRFFGSKEDIFNARTCASKLRRMDVNFHALAL